MVVLKDRLRMKISLLTKNVIAIVITLSILFSIGFYYHYEDLKKYHLDTAQKAILFSSSHFSSNINDHSGLENPVEIEELIQNTIKFTSDVKEFTVIDLSSNILASNLPGKTLSEFDIKSISRSSSKGINIEMNTSGDIWTCRAFITIPPNGPDIKGYLILEKTLEKTQAFLKSVIRNQLIIYLTALLGMILLTIWIATVTLINPIRNISKAIKEVAAGGFSPLPEIEANDELGDLIRSFNTMIEKLASAREELEHHNKNLKEKVDEEANKLKLATHQLHQNEKLSALGQLIAGVAHELNNPLAIIMGNAQLLLALNPEDELCGRINTIYQSAERSQKIVQNLLSFARQAPSKKNYVGINGIITDCLELKSYDYRTHKIETIIDLEEDLPKTMADFNQLQQVCIIILENAQHALVSNTGPKTMRITTEHKDSSIIIKFADNGPGIPKEIQTKIFEPFFTTKESGKGTGLGLSISFGIINKHNGKFYVESNSGNGTTFIIELPIEGSDVAEIEKAQNERAKASSQKSAKNLKHGASGKRVLIVDDENSITDMLLSLLKNDGYLVETARNGKLALEKIQINNFDAVVCDVKMPVMSGIQLYEILKERKPELTKRMIFISGDIINNDTIRFLKSSGCMYLGKPFKIEALRKCIENLISSREYVEPVAPSVFLEKSL